MVTADLIREARLRAGYTQSDLGRRLGQSQSVVARWESGRVTPSFETLRRIVRACDLDLHVSMARAYDSTVTIIDDLLRLTPAQRFTDLLERVAFRERLASRSGV